MPSRFAAARSGVECACSGLWLAWAVMIAALLMAIAPQWFTSANPLEDPRRSAPGAAGALLAGYRPAGARPVDAGGLRRGAFPVGSADRRRHRPVVGTTLGTLAGALAGRVESTIMRPVDVLLAIPPCCCSSR